MRSGPHGGISDPTDDYAYDDYGNLIIDENKGIGSGGRPFGITYNHLNQPIKVKINYGEITYIYDALGRKVQKSIFDPNMGGRYSTTRTEYMHGGFMYKSPENYFYIQHAEGMMAYSKELREDVPPWPQQFIEKYSYNFNHTDHLGNVRLIYQDINRNGKIEPTTEIIEENNFYALGLRQSGYNNATTRWYVNSDNFRLNNKEYTEALGYNVTEMDFRHHDAAIGRWTVQDPVIHHEFSPYSAFDNNPVYFADPSGADSIYNFDTGKYVINGQEVSFDEAMAYAKGGGNSDGSNNNTVSENGSSINNMVTNELIGDSPNIQFPKGQDYENKYPRFTRVIKQVKDYVKNNPEILKWLSYYSGYSTMEVLNQLEYGEGLTLITEILKPAYGQTPHDASSIKVNLKWINGLETAKLNETIQGTSFLIVATILHEFVHYGRMKNNLSEGIYDYGFGFEREAFGEIIGKENANNLYKQNGWSFKK